MKRFLVAISFVAAMCLPAAVQAQQKIVRMNCGGSAYTDTKGNIWQADADFSGGSVSTAPVQVTGTADPALYQTARRNDSGSALVYSIPVANGSYHVNLYFAETSDAMQKTGARVFNVKLQGNPVFTNLDVFDEAGADAALEKGSNVSVSNGTLRIEFDNVTGDAKVDAIEILPGISGPMLTMSFKYPDGTPVVGTLAYAVSSSLASFQGSEPLANGTAQSALFANPSSLGISAQFTVKLSLTDSAGHILWQMNIGMNPADVNLAAVQNSTLNVTVQKM
jgi:Malectin domain